MDVERNNPPSSRIDSEWGQLVEAVPYLRDLVTACRRVQFHRVESFLHSLDTTVAQLPDPDRLAFERRINSDVGKRLLADYAQSVIRSRSERVTAALAILYADAQHREYSSDFKAAAALALEGLAERTIDGFLLLVSHKQDLKHVMLDANHTLCLLASAKRPPALAEWSQGGNEWVGIVHDLIGRGIFLPNIARQIEQQDRSVWSCYFTIQQGDRGVRGASQQGPYVFARFLTRPPPKNYEAQNPTPRWFHRLGPPANLAPGMAL